MSRDKQRLADYLAHILEAIARIARYTEDMDEEVFLGNEFAQDAVIRNIEVIGEASRNIEVHHPDFATAHPELPLAFAYQMRMLWRMAIQGRLRDCLEDHPERSARPVPASAGAERPPSARRTADPATFAAVNPSTGKANAGTGQTLPRGAGTCDRHHRRPVRGHALRGQDVCGCSP
jgi:uncharacterized protein with HEPN domain